MRTSFIKMYLYLALVEAKLAVHQLEQLNSELSIKVERLTRENQELNTENESMSTSKKNVLV